MNPLHSSRGRSVVLALTLAVLGLSVLGFVGSAHVATETIPAQLSDAEFWKISAESSEPDGSFRSDNLLSNELGFQFVIPSLIQTAQTGRVYMGVGPEQNFTYMAALKPRMAFIVDIRRGNLDLQLMYKALFEMSKDRAEFVSRLFSRPRPDGLTAKSTADEIFTAIDKAGAPDALYRDNLGAIKDQLMKKHGFALSDLDLSGIDYVYKSFRTFGPGINYNSSGGGLGGSFATYWDLMVATDLNGQARSYLANEENFLFLKDLESKNMVVPVIGNFGGPKAIRAVGKYLKSIDATVSAFYLSNVEQYLYQDGIWSNFCSNVASLPLDRTSTFIRSVRGGGYSNGGTLGSQLGNMQEDIKACSGR